MLRAFKGKGILVITITVCVAIVITLFGVTVQKNVNEKNFKNTCLTVASIIANIFNGDLVEPQTLKLGAYVDSGFPKQYDEILSNAKNMGNIDIDLTAKYEKYLADDSGVSYPEEPPSVEESNSVENKYLQINPPDPEYEDIEYKPEPNSKGIFEKDGRFYINRKDLKETSRSCFVDDFYTVTFKGLNFIIYNNEVPETYDTFVNYYGNHFYEGEIVLNTHEQVIVKFLSVEGTYSLKVVLQLELGKIMEVIPTLTKVEVQ